MGLLGKYLKTVNMDLAKAPADSYKMAGRPKTLTSVPGKRNIDFNGIDNLYQSDSVTFNIINKMVQWSVRPGFIFRSDRKYITKVYEQFFDNLGRIGEEITKEELAEYILKDLFMYGNSFTEDIYDQTETFIVDTKNIPCRNVDYARTSTGDVAVNGYGKPIGYMIKENYNNNIKIKGDAVPAQFKNIVSMNGNDRFMLPKRIAHYKINAFGDRMWGIGLIQPTLLAGERKQKIEEAQTNSIYTKGTYPVIATVGDERHEASESDLRGVLTTLQNMKHDRYMAFPHYVKVAPLELKQSDIADDALKYLAMGQAAAAGIPMPFATSVGEATNRATLNNQQQMFEQVLEYYINLFVKTFERTVIRRLDEVNEYGGRVSISWGDIRAEEKNDKSKRLVLAVNAQIMAPEEARDYFLKSEDIEGNDDVYKKFIEDSKETTDMSNQLPEFEEDQEKKEITTKKQ